MRNSYLQLDIIGNKRQLIKANYYRNPKEQLLSAKRYYQDDDYLKCLFILDGIINTPSIPIIRQLRAKVREVVNDLQGSICDIECCDDSPANVLMEACLLAKLGFGEESVTKLRSLIRVVTQQEAEKWSIFALGIAGRRFDLELLGIDKMDNKKTLSLDSQMKNCALEHLVALGEFDFCLKLFGDDDSRLSLVRICESLKSVDTFYGMKDSFSIADIENAVSGIRGWLSLDEARLLATLASRVPAECSIVEIGSFQGRSTCALAAGAKSGHNNVIHAIDTFSGLQGIFPEDTLPTFHQNLESKGLNGLVTVHQDTSLQEAERWRRQDVGLLFIDADHNYESVRNDFKAWQRHVSPNGVITFHDSNQKGPNRLLLEILESKTKRVRVVTFRDSITVLCLDPKVYDNFTVNCLWQAYLKALGENYACWLEGEKNKIKKSTIELFDNAICGLNNVNAQMLNQKRNIKNCVTDQPTIVVDVTYMCNSNCLYCQWGNVGNLFRKHLRMEEILLSPKLTSALGTTRIVLSGGEPRLHPQLSQIISYYRKIVGSVVLISNGYNLNRQEVDSLASYGLTGLAVSIDSIDPRESEMTRGTSPRIHQSLISELRAISKHRNGFELGINSVVSSVTANWKTVKGLLEFGNEIDADYVKFQPIFDDGYVGKNAPNLKLNSSHCRELYKISANLESFDHPSTNPPEFWENVADLTMGRLLDPGACNQKENSIYVRNKLSICYWLPSSSYGEPNRITAKTINEQKRGFEIAKINCKVDYHCFCLQNLSHVWNNKGNVADDESK